MESGPADPSLKQTPKRADALDALRGLAMLTMALSGMMPYGVLPPWMYHAQLPPPHHEFDPSLPGLTWVDLVFPFFLFSMGAAIPLALGRRLARGERLWRIVSQVCMRGVLLGLFAIYVHHIKPHLLSDTPGPPEWAIALTGFALLFPMLSRLPPTWPGWRRLAIRVTGWGGAVALLSGLTYADGRGFDVSRNDIILRVLTNVAVVGSLIWLATRRRMLIRLSVLGVLLAARLAHDTQGWVKVIWDFTPVPWMYQFYYLQYLFVVIPGTIVGDLLARRLAAPPTSRRVQGDASTGRWLLVVAIIIAMTIVPIVGLQARWLWATPLATFALCVAGWPLLRVARDVDGQLLRRLYPWGVYWLILGLCFEPYEGGIKKDHPTLSYYFVTTGLAIFTLMALVIVIDRLGQRRPLRLLIDNGQNPMIAYAGISCLLTPVAGLTGVDGLLGRLQPKPWLAFLGACLKVWLLAWFVRFCTRLKLFLRT